MEWLAHAIAVSDSDSPICRGLGHAIRPSVRSSGVRTVPWWAQLVGAPRLQGINFGPTIPKNQIEDVLDSDSLRSSGANAPAGTVSKTLPIDPLISSGIRRLRPAPVASRNQVFLGRCIIRAIASVQNIESTQLTGSSTVTVSVAARGLISRRAGQNLGSRTCLLLEGASDFRLECCHVRVRLHDRTSQPPCAAA